MLLDRFDWAFAMLSGRVAAQKFVVSNYATAHAAGTAPFEVFVKI
jgi:hypothetical protein